jgi:hypothetical protein
VPPRREWGRGLDSRAAAVSRVLLPAARTRPRPHPARLFGAGSPTTPVGWLGSRHPSGLKSGSMLQNHLSRLRATCLADPIVRNWAARRERARQQTSLVRARRESGCGKLGARSAADARRGLRPVLARLQLVTGGTACFTVVGERRADPSAARFPEVPGGLSWATARRSPIRRATEPAPNPP